MQVYIDPETQEIKAVYTGCRTTSKEWSRRGYVEYSSIESWMKPYKSPVRPEPEYIKIVSKDGKTYKIRAELVQLSKDGT
ncbi:unnamed protein product [marine sediment metagenome]|uniref:Uncharacterized protein n=1 Tax=marine sediment metagenome TaxID=412755 RepID=X1EWF0_9ZZZZ